MRVMVLAIVVGALETITKVFERKTRKSKQ